MSDPLPPSELAALKEAATWRNGYRWKPKTMEKLAKKGMVEKRSTDHRGPDMRCVPGYFLTDQARALLDLPRTAP